MPVTTQFFFSDLNELENTTVNIKFPHNASWVILSPIEQKIKEKIEKVGVPLKNWEDIRINYGIKTGCNEAFIIDKAKKDELIRQSPNSVDIIRPILRGKDIKKYGYNFAGLYLLFIPWHFPLHNNKDIVGASQEAEKAFQQEYPAIYNHLLQYKTQLSSRNKAETGIRYEWYALQRFGSNYMNDFSKPKIIYPNMTKYLPFLFDDKKFFVNQKCFIITGKYIGFLTAFFNSSLFKYCFRDAFPELQGGTRELSKIFFENIPVVTINDKIETYFLNAVKDIQNHYTTSKAALLDQMIFELYKLNQQEQNEIGFREIK